MGPSTVVVTGAGGFLGSRIMERLQGKSRVSALYGPADAPCEPGNGTRVFRGDVEDRELLAELVAGAEVVIHLAGPPSVRRSFDDPLGFARTHVVGTAAVADACARARVLRLVYVSSAEVYGLCESSLVQEDEPVRPMSPYAAAKLGAEAFVRAFSERGAQALVLRPFSVYGAGQSKDGVLQRIIDQITANARVELETFRPVRDYVHVDDVAEAILRACNVPLRAAFQIFNVGTGVGTAVDDLARGVMRAFGRELPLCEKAAARPRSTDIARLVADTSRLRDALGWLPGVTLSAGLSRMLEASERGRRCRDF